MTKRKAESSLRRFSTFVEVATIYHALHRTTSSFTNLPKTYVVPDAEPWPAHLRRLRLNTCQVRSHYKTNTLHPETLAALRAINFVFDLGQLKWELKVLALRTYKALHGDLCVPQDFRVPNNDANWPRDLWDMRLGLVVRTIRQRIAPNSDRHAQLSQLGFVWNAFDMTWELKLTAMAAYQQKHGNLLVTYAFKVPRDDPSWPPETWGLTLGHAVHNIRQGFDSISPERKAQLNRLGFVWDCLDLSWETRLTALYTYRSLYGHLRVPFGFVVPNHDVAWPREVWKMKLGHAVHNMRQKLEDMPEERRRVLDDMGFVWNVSAQSWDMQLLALRIYLDTYGHTNLTRDFRIPIHDDRWPPALWNMQLGEFVESLHTNEMTLTPEQRGQLTDIGFVWRQALPRHRIHICDGFSVPRTTTMPVQPETTTTARTRLA
ncbi:hypothetical protein SPRG_20289 [Saprolegnia parasitica CBS 223.65]|uniref:Helicase-associated domain-containing protein n=1 Tax=Saprolegnia parasitica (strain CBS 223.65) TaxID=695850 RepID=A0A067CG29_SAPPC|nr:hypothetical protein SPRG_20289 [Saprolegnia parasitica CBS 223.65]KDO28130.1 hypothetical protein SPRG_20289 [Saprolegnia parasitica CBS 223.65]|eukprot:XP_012201268.1 hypothetical protein SPRG_20289 [Saprolegnia parasitica CBS 223.65]